MQSILTIVFTAILYWHPFYVSVTEINHNQEEKTLECTIKTFTSDIEDALKNQGFGNLAIGTNQELSTADSIINNYLNEVFQFKINDQPISFKYLGKEVEEDVSWLYLEIENVEQLKSIQITNTLLFDFQEEQSNLVHLFTNDKEYSFLFKTGRETDILTF